MGRIWVTFGILLGVLLLAGCLQEQNQPPNNQTTDAHPSIKNFTGLGTQISVTDPLTKSVLNYTKFTALDKAGLKNESIGKYATLMLDRNGKEILATSVANRINAANLLLDCDLFTCNYIRDFNFSTNQILSSDLISGLSNSANCVAGASYFIDYRNVTKTRPTYTDVLMNYSIQANGTNASKAVFYNASVQNGTETYTEIEAFQNTEIDGKKEKTSDSLRVITPFTKKRLNVGCDIYDSVLGIERKEGAWFNTSMTYKKNETLNTSVDEQLNNFIYYFTTNTASLIAAGKMQGNCSDAMVVNSSETGVATFEIENNTCNTTSTVFKVRFNQTALQNTTDTVYLYYGNTTPITSQQNVPATNNFWLDAWEFSENSGTSYASAGTLGTTLTTTGTINQQNTSACKYGRCVNQSSTAHGNYLTATAPTYYRNPVNFTFLAWANQPATLNHYKDLINVRSADTSFYWAITATDGNNYFSVNGNGAVTTNKTLIGGWTAVGATWSGSGNPTWASTNTTIGIGSFSYYSSATVLNLFGYSSSDGEPFPGYLDEVYVTNVTVTQNYLKAWYGQHATEGTEQTNTVTGTLTVNATIGGTATGNNSTFTPPANLTINATANSGYYFFNWTSNCNDSFANSTNPNTQIQVNDAVACYAQANFKQYGNLTVNATVGGTATGNNSSFIPPSNLTINATASAGYYFINWSVLAGNATVNNSTSINTFATVYNTTAAVMQANFGKYGNLTVNSTAGGSATGSNSSFITPANLTINATVNTNYYFVNWITNCNASFANSTNANTQIQVNDGTACYATANFALIWYTTGGTMTYDGLYTVVTFTANGSLNVTGTINATVLVVAGGGSGGRNNGDRTSGGGGAGGLLYNTSYNAVGNITVVVGAGGITPSAGTPCSNGTNSSFGIMNATGGGCGGSVYTPYYGANGGSGGGAFHGVAVGANGTAGQGYGGGGGYSNDPYYSAGGGGGALLNGTAGAYQKGGAGGNGTNYTINGSNVYYAGGGGGGAEEYPGGVGGAGGGGTGGNNAAGTAGTNGTGGGGGGGAGLGVFGNGAAGGSGIVIIRYLTYPLLSPTISSITVVPSNATNFNNVSCNLTMISPNNMSGNVTGNWSKNGAVLSAFTYQSVASNVPTLVANLTTGNYTVGDNISCSAFVQILGTSSPVNYSANVTIRNGYGTLTVNSSNPAWGSATGNNSTFIPPANLSINGTPSTGYYFANWTVTTGNCTVNNSTNANTQAQVLNTSICNVQANFLPYGNLTVNASIGGTATGNNSTFIPPKNLTVTANASVGYYFSGCIVTTGNCSIISNATTSCVVQVLNTSRCNVQANFAHSPINVTVALPAGITQINLSCFQPYMNDTQPNGQDIYTPILNITNIGSFNITVITIALNQSLPSGFSIYGCAANYRNPSCPSLNTTNQTVLRSGIKTSQSKGVWWYGICSNVTDNQTVSFNYTVGGT